MDSEELYCHEISRRSVARASLHLGIDSMSQDLLDVLSDVLQHYIARIGKTMAFLVESSGRPSSHSNVLDAIQAIQMTTAPAVYQMNESSPGDGNTNGNKIINSMRDQRSAPWRDLAVFCFGPEWEGNVEKISGPAGGKVGPSAVTNEAGWRAPFLEEVPPFPKTKTENVANPHNMKPHIALSLHADMPFSEETDTEKKLIEIPDKVFTEWGTPQIFKSSTTNGDKSSTNDASKDDNLNNVEKLDQQVEEPAKKKRKLMDHDNDQRKYLPSYIPDFMPRLPETLHAARSIIDLPIDSALNSNTYDLNTPTISAEEGTLGVRSSLVDLESSNKSSSYWGSGWDANPKVPVGRIELDGKAKATVVRLEKASNSRISRILEGSMDAAH